ncbi:MAG: preprotein translocase subunit SecA [Sedimentisphaerales bacterium]|nr:preprotein translocase subunit SecA [Sedimentisphaerales bacterium]
MILSSVINKLFKRYSRNERLIKAYMAIAKKAGQYEEQVQALDDEALKAKTNEFKAALASGKSPEDILPEAFAVVREAARRTVQMRHFDVQLIGGNVLYEGKIAEMATGEGKTLVATLAAYLVHLTGCKVHIVTVNDYLAKRDAEWMGPIYRALGLTVGVIQADMDTWGPERRSQYQCDITYGTNNEFGFDYLRDNMKASLDQMVQGLLEYAIIDEVDSILIDEARTPLIISGPAFDDVTRYKKADQVARALIARQADYDRLTRQVDTIEREIANAQGQLSEAKKSKDQKAIDRVQERIDHLQEELEKAKAQLAKAVQYYEVEHDRKAVHLTHEGITAAQELAGLGSFFTGSNIEWPHLLEQGLRAHVVFQREKDYVVMDGKVVIVDEFTGRLMHGRQWSDGLHQAVEAKEGVQIKEETQTLATITLQNFFRLYGQIAGMTGTAATEAEEFQKIYNLEVVVIPPNKPCIRKDYDDVIYKTMREKFNAIVEEINKISSQGRPLLIGTISIEKSELLSEMLTRRYGIEHEVLNAKHHAREAAIVAKAGQQHIGRDGKVRGNVTIATNMAGRGTDIKLGPGVAEIGGLHIIGTERHEARRIDNQLRGRAGRQGDAGSSQFFLSFDDDLMRIFAPEWTVKALTWIGWHEGEPIVHRRISKGIERAQKKVEQRNFEIRKSLLEYDEVMDYQRKTFYAMRRKILAGKGLKSIILDMIESVIKEACENMLDPEYPHRCIVEWTRQTFDVELGPSDLEGLKKEQIEQLIKEKAKEAVSAKVTMSLGEYMEDQSDPDTWDLDGLKQWAMSAFRVNLSVGKIRSQTYDQIEQMLVQASQEQVDKRDCAQLGLFLADGFATRRLAEWVRGKFGIELAPDQLKGIKPDQAYQLLVDQAKARYRQREIEYPVDLALSMIAGHQAKEVYPYQELAQWANKRFGTELTAEQLQSMSERAIREQLLELNRAYLDGRLVEQIRQRRSQLQPDEFASWFNQRFDAAVNGQDLDEAQLVEIAQDFFRKELSELERYVLIQVCDMTWKDHLYAMDHLKDSIWTQSFAEKDPKVEYKREGFRMFNTMLKTIRDRVTDIIFKVRVETGSPVRSVWNVSRVSHDQLGQFDMVQQQRQAAIEASGSTEKVRQIKLETPKVGRNDPCPCGSGKKYKKCCGRQA